MPKNPRTTASNRQDEVILNFNLPIEMPSVYATNLLVQPGEFEVIISFFEIQPPLLGGKNEAENLNLLKKSGLRADCVARVTIAKERLHGFADALKAVSAQLKKQK